jgi:hypothetical protein
MLAEPFDDHRRGRCVARVHELRAALAGEGVQR